MAARKVSQPTCLGMPSVLFTLGFFAVGSNPEKKAFILKGPNPGVQHKVRAPVFFIYSSGCTLSTTTTYNNPKHQTID
jgi:hypothetical protein